MSQLP